MLDISITFLLIITTKANANVFFINVYEK